MPRPQDAPDRRHHAAVVRLRHMLLCALLLLSACGTFEVGLVPTPTATPSLLRYENTSYGFTFTYPSAWQVEEAPHRVQVRRGSLVLRIGYKRVDEAEEIGALLSIPTEGTAYIQKLTFLDQTMPAEAMIYNRKIKAITYQPPRPATADDLVYAITLTDLAGDAGGEAYADIDIPDAAIEEAGRILESFERMVPAGATPPSGADVAAPSPPAPRPGWARYINAKYGFAFQYPTSWELAQTGGGEGTASGALPDTVTLTHGDTALTVQVQRSGETHALGTPHETTGEVQSGGLVSFMEETVAKRLLIHHDVTKCVSFRAQSKDLEFFVHLAQATDSPLNSEDFALGQATQEEVDAVLRTFAPYP